jgi:hypothetical protein
MSLRSPLAASGGEHASADYSTSTVIRHKYPAKYFDKAAGHGMYEVFK